MKEFGWRKRLQYVTAAGLAGWFTGFLLTIPFETAVAWRYVSGQSRLFPWTLAEGLAIWGGFTLLIGFAAWAPIALPAALLIPPRWIVRARWILAPASMAAAILVLGLYMHLFLRQAFADLETFLSLFFTAQMVFASAFALVMSVTYIVLAARRLGAALDSA